MPRLNRRRRRKSCFGGRPVGSAQAQLHAVAASWTNFVRHGDRPGLSNWPKFTADGQRVLWLDDQITTGGVPNRTALDTKDGYLLRLAPDGTATPRTELRKVPFGSRPVLHRRAR